MSLAMITNPLASAALRSIRRVFLANAGINFHVHLVE